MGWGQLQNGDLLTKAEAEFEAFITTDQNLKYQQNLTGRNLAILVLPTNDWERIRAKVHEIVAELSKLESGGFVELNWK